MLTVEKQIIIDLPYRNCWEKVKDISLANNYIPNVEKIEIITSKKEGVGASRKAYLAGGKKVVDETVIECIKDNQTFIGRRNELFNATWAEPPGDDDEVINISADG